MELATDSTYNPNLTHLHQRRRDRLSNQGHHDSRVPLRRRQQHIEPTRNTVKPSQLDFNGPTWRTSWSPP